MSALYFFGRQRSFLGSNVLFCCERYEWSMIQFINNSSQFKDFPFNSLFLTSLSEVQNNSASFLCELLSIREDRIFLPHSFFSHAYIRYYRLCINSLVNLLHIYSIFILFHLIMLLDVWLYWRYVHVVRINIIIKIIIIIIISVLHLIFHEHCFAMYRL